LPDLDTFRNGNVFSSACPAPPRIPTFSTPSLKPAEGEGDWKAVDDFRLGKSDYLLAVDDPMKPLAGDPDIVDRITRYWRMDPTADYGLLNRIARHRLRPTVIKDNWDDLLRLAGSLKLGVVQALSIMRTLQIGDRPTKLAQAVAELGRIDKTMYCLTYIDDEAKRRRILSQLNHGEDRHKLARFLFHGKCGELRQRYREGQEDQLGALGLVVNIIVLWNTVYIAAALHQLAAEGFPIQSEDVARLSPLLFDHINLLGRFAFSVPESVQRGELRPLRTPAETLSEMV